MQTKDAGTEREAQRQTETRSEHELAQKAGTSSEHSDYKRKHSRFGEEVRPKLVDTSLLEDADAIAEPTGMRGGGVRHRVPANHRVEWSGIEAMHVCVPLCDMLRMCERKCGCVGEQRIGRGMSR